MPDKKLTDNEIIKALECCSKAQGRVCTMSECPLYCGGLACDIRTLLQNTLDLINRQKAQIEKLEKVEHFADKTIATLQAENERLKEENERLKKEVYRKALL